MLKYLVLFQFVGLFAGLVWVGLILHGMYVVRKKKESYTTYTYNVNVPLPPPPYTGPSFSIATVTSEEIKEEDLLSSEFGYRLWFWSFRDKKLYSPVMWTEWVGPELIAEKYEEENEIRNRAGIHALRAPKNWKEIAWSQHGELGSPWSFIRTDEFGFDVIVPIRGICERMGRYQLGTIGWRSEVAIIKALAAPTLEIGLEIEKKFPDVEVIYK